MALRAATLHALPLLLFLAPWGVFGSKAVIRLGCCYGGTYPEIGPYFFMAKLGLDMGYFDDILPANASSAAFSVSLTPVDDGCNGAQATQVALPLMLGVGAAEGRIYSSTTSSEPVVGIAGCDCSAATMPMANLGNNFKVPMVSGASTNPDLSNKGLYPFFSRTVPPDSMQGAAFAALVMYYKWRRVLAAYPAEPYAQGIAGAFKSKLSTSTSGVTYLEYQLPYQQLMVPSMAAKFDHQSWKLIVDQVAHESPQPRIFFSAGTQLDHMLRLFSDLGLVSNQTCWLLSEAMCSISKLTIIGQAQAQYQAFAPAGDTWYSYDWMHLPQQLKGMLCFTPSAFGPKASGAKFQNFFASMNRSAIEAAGWLSARDGWRDVWLTAAFFATSPWYPLMFDAMSLLIYAIGEMLGRGTAPADVRGAALRDQIRVSQFEGLSGAIALDANGDRLAPYNIWNMLVASSVASLSRIGVYDSLGEAISWSARPIFADGTTDPPADRPPPCSPGTEYGGALIGCVPCRPGKASVFFGATCVNCSAGYFQSAGGASACEPAPRGAVVATGGAVAATTCPLGFYAGERALTDCALCAAGTFAATPGLSACQKAPPGSYVSSVGATAQQDCPAGHFSAVEGAQECTVCLGGFFQNESGKSECNRCEHGSYAWPAATSCTACPAGMITESAASAHATDCQCPLGQFCRGTYPECDCQSCLEGMSCPWGAKEQDTMPYNPSGVPLLVQPHYYTTADAPLSVYYCHPSLDSSRCVGGPPEACSQLFEGLTCARCPEGYAPKGGGCEECSGDNRFVLAIMPILGVAACVVAYYGGNRQVEANTNIMLGTSVVFGLLVTMAQLFATFSQLTMPWPSDINNFFIGTRFVVINPNVISAYCLGTSVRLQYSLRFILPYCVVAGMMLCFAVAKALQKMRCLPGRFCWQLPKAVNSVFQMYQSIFIALTAIAVVPYQCYSHPNGQSSLIQFPTVVCSSSEHRGLVAMSVVLTLTFVLPFLGALVWASVYAMVVRGDVERSMRHLQMFRFLMYRFRPDVWWWGTPFTIRQLLLAFAPMVQPDDPHSQCIFVVAVLVAYVPLVCFFWPWKSDELNLLDAVSMAFITVLVAAGGAFIPQSQFNAGHLILMKVVLIILGIFGGLLFIYGVYVVFAGGSLDLTGVFGVNEKRSKKHKAIMNLTADLLALGDTLKAATLEEVVETLLLMNSYDLSAVHKAIAAFQASKMPIQGGSGLLPRRLIAVPSSCGTGGQSKITKSHSMEIAEKARSQGFDAIVVPI